MVVLLKANTRGGTLVLCLNTQAQAEGSPMEYVSTAEYTTGVSKTVFWFAIKT